jgi:VWFA-related protein
MRPPRSASIPLRIAVLLAMATSVAAAQPVATAAAGHARPFAQVSLADGPQVKIVTPAIDRPLADPIVIQALVRAAPGRTVARVTAFLDGRDLGVRTRPPYRWVVPRPENAAAVHVLIAAADSAGAETRIEELVTREPGMRFTAEVPAVTLNLAAIDANERFVSDLQPEELVIRDNGEVQEILDFARGEAPLRISLLVDQSGSMADKMEETLAALTRFLRQLGPDDQVKLMAFNDRVTSYTPFTNMHELVGSFAQAIRAEGDTALYDALLYGYRQLASHQDARERRVIFLLTDGDDRASRNALRPALERIRNGGVTVFALAQGEALDSGNLRDVLREIADQTGGEAFFEKDKSKLDGVFAQVAAAMRALYLVSYRPTDSTRGWHRIEVEASRPDLRLRHKPGYDRAAGEGGR